MSRHQSPLVAQRHDSLRQRLQELKAAQPFWGDRSIWTYRRVVEARAVNKQRVLRLMRAPHVVVKFPRTLRAKRTPTGSTPRPTKPNAWWGLDMTQILGEDCGWVSSVVGLDGYPQMIVGYDTGTPCTARHGLAVLDMAVNRQCPAGARDQGLSLMRDHGCQPTALAFMQACSTLGSQQACTSDTHPKGNADTERVMRTRKAECRWLSEWTSPLARMRALERWLAHDHEPYLHSSLGYQAPRPFARDDHCSHGTPFVAA
jgi:transposase InsO family protein